MRARSLLLAAAVSLLPQLRAAAQLAPAPPEPASLPDIPSLLADVERNQKKMEALQRDYTYHVHVEQQDLDNDGGVKRTQTQDAESLTIDGVRVNRVVARNGKPLTADEQQKESDRVDKEIARAKERRARLQAKGRDTDARGDEVLPLSRILELGSFAHPRRETRDGRPVIVVDYAGNPQAKTHSTFENIMRDVVGTVAIDEQDRILAEAQGQFLNDFKLGGGLVADVKKGSRFAFHASRVGEGIWLPRAIDGQGSVRVMLFLHFNGRLHLTAGDYRKFRTSAVIVGSHGAIDGEGTPVPDEAPLGSAKPQDGPPPAQPPR